MVISEDAAAVDFECPGEGVVISRSEAAVVRVLCLRWRSRPSFVHFFLLSFRQPYTIQMMQPATPAAWNENNRTIFHEEIFYASCSLPNNIASATATQAAIISDGSSLPVSAPPVSGLSLGSGLNTDDVIITSGELMGGVVKTVEVTVAIVDVVFVLTVVVVFVFSCVFVGV